MLKGMNVGIDIINVERFEKKHYDENKMFYKKIFNESEIKYCLKFKHPFSHFAGKFAVKEATKKSLNHNIPMKNIETSHSNSKPIILIDKLKNYSFLVSLSHENDLAIAVVISLKLD